MAFGNGSTQYPMKFYYVFCRSHKFNWLCRRFSFLAFIILATQNLMFTVCATFCCVFFFFLLFDSCQQRWSNQAHTRTHSHKEFYTKFKKIEHNFVRGRICVPWTLKHLQLFSLRTFRFMFIYFCVGNFFVSRPQMKYDYVLRFDIWHRYTK